MDSYTIQYNASVMGCSDVLPSTNTTFVDSSTTTFEITNLEEDSTVMGTVAAVNIRGNAFTQFTTNTIATRMYGI